MKTIDKKLTHHLFVCCRQRDGKPCCSSQGAEELVTKLKKWVKEEALNDQVKVTKSSCLGHCETGITACLYPENLWLQNLSLNDEEQIQSLLKNSAPVMDKP